VLGGEDSPADFTTLGDNANIAARLASDAGPGKILVSDAAYSAANLNLGDLEHQQLDLKAKSAPIGVRLLSIAEDR
jgi:class 3 adenylate cyclase